MSATLVVTNEAFELLWRSQSYCFMTPAAVENLRKCHAKFLAEKSLHGTRCRTVVRKYWRHVPLPQPPEHNHGANMCLIDLSTWPAPPPDAVEVMETDCTMYHIDKDFVLWAVHPADQPEAMVHSIRVLEIARLVQWMKPRRGPHPHPKSRSLVVVDGSDMTILATYPPGVMQDELRLGSSVFEIVGDEDRDSFAERPPTQLYLPNLKDHGKTRRKFNAVPIALLDGFLFVIEEADDEDLSVAAAQSMVSLSTGGFQQLSALIREDAQAPGGQAQDGSDGPASSSLGLPSSPQVSQLQHSESHVSTPAQHLPPPPPPPALHPQWSSHPPTPTVPMPALAAKKAPSSNIPSWQLPPLPKYRDSYYAANNHNHAGVPTPGTSTHSTWSSAHAHSAPAAASDRVQHPLPRIHPPRLVVPFAPPMLSNPSAAAAAAAAAAGSMYESPRSMTFDARSRSAKDGSVGFTSPMYGRDYGPHAAHAAIYPPLLSPMSTASSGPHGSAYPSRSSTASGVAGASEQSWYAQQHQQQQQYPDAPRGSTSHPRYRTFDIVADAATDRAIHPPSSSHHRSTSYHQQRPTPQFVPAHDALGEVYFEPPVFPAPQNYPSSYIHGHPPQPHPYPPHARHMPSFSSAPYARPGPPPRPDDILPHLAGPYHDERYGLQECYPSAPPPQHPQHPPVPSPGSYSSKQHGYPPHQHPQYAHHPSAADVYPPSHDAYSPQTAQCATGRHAAWATPQYASVPGADPYAHPFGYHGLPPPPPLPTLMAPVPRAKAEPSAAGGMYPLEPSAEAEAETADVYGTGAPQFGNGYGYALKSSAEQPHLAHPRHQEWQAQGHHQAMYEPVAQEDHEPMGSQLDDDAQHLPRQGDAHTFGQAIASTRGQGSGGADDVAEDGLDEDDDEDAPILDLGHTHATRAPSSAAATGPRSKRSNSSRGGQRLSTSKRKRGISPQLTPAANALANANANLVHGDDSAVGGLSSKFVAGYVNPRYPMRPSPHGVPCARCGMLESPEWRRGEAGIRDLCNACGLKYYREKKQREKVARRAAAGPSSSSVPLVAAADVHGPSSSVTLRGHPE